MKSRRETDVFSQIHEKTVNNEQVDNFDNERYNKVSVQKKGNKHINLVLSAGLRGSRCLRHGLPTVAVSECVVFPGCVSSVSTRRVVCVAASAAEQPVGVSGPAVLVAGAAGRVGAVLLRLVAGQGVRAWQVVDAPLADGPLRP